MTMQRRSQTMTTGRALVAAEQAKVFVVSVSGTSGAGKSSVIEKAAALLPSATRLQFDDYVTLGNDIATIRAWLDAGAQLDAIKTPGMADDLRRLIARQAIHLPGSGRRVEPADVVVLEEPFGRSRGEFSSLIDFAVFIDAPLRGPAGCCARSRPGTAKCRCWSRRSKRSFGSISPPAVTPTSRPRARRATPPTSCSTACNH
jgi:uridine kinase